MKLERPETHPGICSLGCSVALGARNCLQVNSSVGYALRTSLEGEAPDGRETEAVNTGPAKPAVEGRRTFQSPCFASATQPLGVFPLIFPPIKRAGGPCKLQVCRGLRASAGSTGDRAAKGSSLGLLEEHLFELPRLSKGNNASWFGGLEHLRRNGLGRQDRVGQTWGHSFLGGAT